METMERDTSIQSSQRSHRRQNFSSVCTNYFMFVGWSIYLLVVMSSIQVSWLCFATQVLL